MPDSQQAAQAAAESNSAYCRDDFTGHLSQSNGGMRDFRYISPYMGIESNLVDRKQRQAPQLKLK
jgi:hypothetical protein